MFEIDRTFCQRNNKTGLMEWFFQAREGLVGPYSSKQIAIEELNIFIGRRSTSGDDGGRSSSKTKLTLVPFACETGAEFISHDKRKKGIDD